MTIQEEIKKLKKEKNAIILAHYYVADKVQAVADYIGDSYYLCKMAKQTNADIIVFCGVHFMGESAVVLNPDKKVIMPDIEADCAMAHMIDEKTINDIKKRYDDLAVVCYINSTIQIKALADVCVTSSNAVKIVKNLPNKNIFFIPDGNLGRYVSEQVPEKNVILNNGCCPIHIAITANEVKKAKQKYPNAKFLVHPECTKDVLAEADYIGSTAEIIEFAAKDSNTEYIIGTENGVLYELKRQNPEKSFYTVIKNQVCPDMKLITLEKLKNVLKEENNEVEVDKSLQEKALIPLERMLELAK